MGRELASIEVMERVDVVWELGMDSKYLAFSSTGFISMLNAMFNIFTQYNNFTSAPRTELQFGLPVRSHPC